MNEWIHHALSSDQAGISILFAVFLLGVVGVFSCGCNYAVIGTVVGYSGAVGSSGRTKTIVWSSIFFLIGSILAMSVIGCLIGYAGEFISTSLGNYWKIAAGLISILFGLYTIDIFPFKIPGLSINVQKKKNGILSAVLFGLAIGGISSLCGLCCSPFMPVILAASFVKGNMIWGVLMLFSYALGYGITLAAAMIGIGLGLGKISKSLSGFAKVLKYAGGITLILLGFYFLLTI
jgi:cytochrome c biogenesis protein CcdA